MLARRWAPTINRLPKAFLSAAIVLLAGAASAQDTGNFDPFVVDDLSAPGTVRKINDPTGTAPVPKVYSFRIPAGYCNDRPYDDSGPESDCTFKSTRSQIREDVFATPRFGTAQPAQSWYGWYVYFPSNFAYGPKQTKGNYEFAYWHNHQCPHLTFQNSAGADSGLYLQRNRALGNFECEVARSIKVADFKDLVGRWAKFEVFVKWSSGASGRARVYIDGKLKTSWSGPTLVKGYEKINYFKFGIYLCCTNNVHAIKGTGLYFAAVKRAGTRAGVRPRN